jgi:hypothetical protein
LNAYILDYLRRNNLMQTAEMFEKEANISHDAVLVNTPHGFLYEWWTVFWDVFSARTTKQGTPHARAYVEVQKQKLLRQHVSGYVPMQMPPSPSLPPSLSLQQQQQQQPGAPSPASLTLPLQPQSLTQNTNLIGGSSTHLANGVMTHTSEIPPSSNLLTTTTTTTTTNTRINSASVPSSATQQHQQQPQQVLTSPADSVLHVQSSSYQPLVCLLLTFLQVK